MQVKPVRTPFAKDTDVRLRVTLSAHGGAVCYGRPSYFAISLDRDEGEETCETHVVYECGMQALPLLPLYVLLIPAAALDVADLSGRFTVIPGGHERSYLLAVASSGSGLQVRNLDEPKSRNQFLTETNLPPGRYRVRVELIEEHHFPAPLFWAPYDKAVVAETEFRIEAANEAASR
jgi:hypothetical protein